MVGSVKLKSIPSLSPQPEKFATLLHGVSKQRISNETTRLKSSKIIEAIESVTQRVSELERVEEVLHTSSRTDIYRKATEAIESVTQRVSELEGVEEVQHTFNRGDIHRVTFQIKSDCECSESLWKAAQSLIVETCMNLRDATKERWYFYTELVEDFNENVFDF